MLDRLMGHVIQRRDGLLIVSVLISACVNAGRAI